MELPAAAGIIAARCGLRARACITCTSPRYEQPIVPTFPFDHGCVAAHVVASYPSATSAAEMR